MKTRFLFHGGGFSHETKKEAEFFRGFTKDLSDGDTVLFIGFARPDDGERQEIFERDKGYVLASTDKDISVENAQLETVVEQTKQAQAILITGGDTRGLVADLKEKDGFIEALKGKVVAGTSAGAYLFSTYFYSCGENKVFPGLGTFPIKMVCHYGGTQFDITDEDVQKMKDYPGEGLELMVIPEQEWVAKEVDL